MKQFWNKFNLTFFRFKNLHYWITSSINIFCCYVSSVKFSLLTSFTVSGYKVDKCEKWATEIVKEDIALGYQLDIFDIYCSIWTSYNTKGGLIHLTQNGEEAIKNGIAQVN